MKKTTLSGDFESGYGRMPVAVTSESPFRRTSPKIECGGGEGRSSRPRKHGVEDRYNQDRGDYKRGEGHHRSSPFA
jgi:hypothetical protein